MRSPTILGLLIACSAIAQSEPYSAEFVERLAWRNLGPANMGGRITDLAIVPDSSTWYVASASGGLWKTKNAGTTWQPLFQDQATVSIGDVAVAPSNRDVVWVGTGEENGRNSVSWGDGVYKSIDGGRSFTHMGLRDTFQIGHIAIHPADADVVYVAALGKLWSHNDARGVFRTRDGGETWQRVLFIDDKTGVIDVRIDPVDPNIVYACGYERMRDAFDGNDPVVRFGEAAGLFKSTDGGDSWRRIENGLPTCNWGRSGLTVLASDPKTLFMTVETERSGWATGEQKHARPRGNALMGVRGEPTDGGIELASVTDGGAADQAGLRAGDVVQKLGDETVAKRSEFTNAIRAKNAGDTVTVTYLRDGEQRTTEMTYGKREQRGPDVGDFGMRLGGQQMNKQDEQGESGFETGGVFRSDDHGETWRRVNSLTERPFYYSVIAVDPRDANNLYSCGVSFYASRDGGQEFKAVQRNIHVDFHAIWVDPNDSDHLLIGCDGGLYETWDRCATWRHIDNFAIGQFYHADVDQAVPYNVYGGLQDNGTWGGPSRTRFRDGIRIADWRTIAGGDGFRARIDPDDPSVVFATSQNGGLLRQDVRRARRGGAIRKPDGIRWNWDTPFFLSPHNPRVLYFAGSKACRSMDRGTNSRAISETITLTDRGSATAFAESPIREGLLYVGTDDGALWRTDDGGHNWHPLHDHIDLPGPRYVSHIEPSHYAPDRVYVTFEGHRSDDRNAYCFASDDRGATWRSLTRHLPNEPCHVIREFPSGDSGSNANLLFVGTEFGCYVSLDRGDRWFDLGERFPTVAVRDIAIQTRDTDLVAATHGRGLWVIDVDPLVELTPKIARRDAYLFHPEPAVLWERHTRYGFGGHAAWYASNPRHGVKLHVWMNVLPEQDAAVTIHDIHGKTLHSIELEPRTGMHVLHWNARVASETRRGEAVEPGAYSVRFGHGDIEFVRRLDLLPDPNGGKSPYLDTAFPGGQN